MDDHTSYLIEYSIKRRRPGEEEFREIGFGSSGEFDDLDACTHMISTDVERGAWEAEEHQPAPGVVLDEIRAARDA